MEDQEVGIHKERIGFANDAIKLASNRTFVKLFDNLNEYYIKKLLNADDNDDLTIKTMKIKLNILSELKSELTTIIDTGLQSELELSENK